MCRILVAIHPQASRNLIFHALHHDTGEVGTGDVPSGMKRRFHTVKQTFDNEEASTYRRMVIPWGLPILSPLERFERWTLGLADMLELWEFGLQEQQMGNRLADLVVGRAGVWVEETLTHSDADGSEYPAIVGAAREYMRRRAELWKT